MTSSTLPSTYRLLTPILKKIRDGKHYRLAEVQTWMIAVLNLKQDQISKERGGILSRIAWAVSYLREVGYIITLEKGVFAISSEGIWSIDTMSEQEIISYIKKIIGKSKKSANKPISSGLKSITLSNIRSLKDQTINFKDGVNIIVGNNGTCKTTLLKTIGLITCEEKDAFSVLKQSRESFERIKTKDSRALLRFHNRNESNIPIAIETSFTDNNKISEERKRNIIEIFSDEEVPIVDRSTDYLIHDYASVKSNIRVFGIYGAQRNSSTELLFKNDDVNVLRPRNFIETLFGYPRNYIDPALAWKKLEDYHLDDENFREHFDNTQKHLISFLGLSKESCFWVDSSLVNGNISNVLMIGVKDDSISFFNLSDGQKNVLLLVIDILYGISVSIHRSDKTIRANGIVLIDEIENHLHPSMERKILSLLTKCFPKVQFIVTTHSPNIILGKENANIISLNRKGRNLVTCETFIANKKIETLSVSKILSDRSFFNVPIFSESLERKINRYTKLFNIIPDERTEKDNEELGKLANYFYNHEIVDEPDLIDYRV